MYTEEKYMDTPLPGMTTGVSSVDIPEPIINVTVLSSVHTTEQQSKQKKTKGINGFFRRTWKAIKRPFHRSCRETIVEDIVPPPLLPETPVPCASGLQQTPDREQNVSHMSPHQPPTTAFSPDEGKEQHAKEKKRKGIRGVFKRTWKAAKRPFHRRKTIVEDIVPPLLPETPVPCASGLQQTPDREQNVSHLSPHQPLTTAFSPDEGKGDDELDVVSITSSDWSVCNNIQQDCALPADASAEDTERISLSDDVENKPQERHAKVRKGKAICRSFQRKLLLLRWRFNRHFRRHKGSVCSFRHCPHHRCCMHTHPCPYGPGEFMILPIREQISSTLPSDSGPSLNFEQARSEDYEEEKGRRGFLKRLGKAIKCPFSCRKTKLENFVLVETPLSQYKEENKPQEKQAVIVTEKCEGVPLSVPSIFKPSDGIIESRYKRTGRILGSEHFGFVFSAVRISDGKKVAIKEIWRKDRGSSVYHMAGYLQPVMNEVAMMSLLQQPPISPYVIQMLEWFHEPDYTYFIMEDPGDFTVLKKLLELHPLDEKIARVLMRQAVLAAQHCIAHGVFHTNIHAGNILVNMKTLDLKLIDFGCAVSYTGTKYDQHYGQNSPPESEYHAVPGSVWQLGGLLFQMVYGANFSVYRLPLDIHLSSACRSLLHRCEHRDPTERPTFEQILQHHWFNQE